MKTAAYQKGFLIGRNEELTPNPYKHGTIQWQEFEQGWEEGWRARQEPTNEEETMARFEYRCACSYPAGPHTAECLNVNDRRLEGQCQKVREAEGEEEALRFWQHGCHTICQINR